MRSEEEDMKNVVQGCRVLRATPACLIVAISISSDNKPEKFSAQSDDTSARHGTGQSTAG